MKSKQTTVTDIDGNTIPATQVMCPNGCDVSAFLIFFIGPHQHLQCVQCDESFCDGSCAKEG